MVMHSENPKEKRLRYVLRSVAVLLAAIAVILFTGLLPSYLTKLDMTGNSMYTPSERTREVVASLDKDVNIYLVASSGEANETISVFTERYAGLSKHVKTRVLDPKNDAALISAFTSSVLSSPDDNTVIVASDDRSVVIPFGEMFYYSPEAYFMAYYRYSQYYSAGYIGTNCSFRDFLAYYAPILGLYDGFCYEDRLTSAIDLVAGNAKKVCIPTGHGEKAIDNPLQIRLVSEGIELVLVDLTEGDLPADADAVWLCPTSDISVAEKNKLAEYVGRGGSLVVMTSYSGTARANLDALLASYGLINTNSYLCEDTENYYFEYEGLLLPNVPDAVLSEKLDALYGNVLLGGATGITVSETLPDGVSVTPILISSPGAYTKTELNSFRFDAETDVRGEYYTGVSAEVADGGEVIWFSSDSLIGADYDVYTNRGNTETFVYCLGLACGNGDHVVIPPMLPANVENTVTPGNVYVYLAVFCLALPAVIIAIPIIRRRVAHAGK